MARFIAARFAELARYVPPERKPWMSEDPRMAVFDAPAFALTVLRTNKASPMIVPNISVITDCG